MSETESTNCDVLLIGAGIMSATLAAILKEVQPDLHIELYERLGKPASESSDAWNNAGTGHAALCELNYTPQDENGTFKISKAIHIMESFEQSKQFWAYLVKDGYFWSPKTFIRSVPHHSVVFNEIDKQFLQKRYEALQSNHLFSGMQYTEDKEVMKEWFPLVMEGRTVEQPMAATRSELGTDVNFGELTRMILHHLQIHHEIEANFEHEVTDLSKNEDGTWKVTIFDEINDSEKEVHAKFVFIGAGGGALPLLEKSDIDEGRGYAGFPVTGEWLVCKNETVIEQHHAKVYGKAATGSPPMSVPHLDSRIIDGKKELLFGPFAGFSTKFLKEGSILDWTSSVTFDNLIPMLGAGWHNIPLTKYLIEQVLMSFEEKMEQLRDFVPTAKNEDWEIAVAGQRVQVIKKDDNEGGKLEFGTEVVCATDGSLASLLGASPGASTSVAVMLEILEKCFAEQMHTPSWQSKLNEMIPSYQLRLSEHPDLTLELRSSVHKILLLEG